MFAPYRSLASSYRNMDVETSLQDASPHKLIAMLYDGAVAAVNKAKGAIERGDIASKGGAITFAIRIVEEGLRASLDPRGGDIAVNLGDLYSYMGRRLLEASLRNDTAILDEVAKLLGELRGGWAGIASAGQGPSARAS